MRGRKDMILSMPVRGVDETQAHSNQRPETTLDAENMRSVDGGRRVRISQREGMAKHYEAAMSGPVRVLATLVYENKTVTYEATEDEIESNGDGREKHELIWEKKTEGKGDVRNVLTDLGGNVYLVTERTIEKRSGSGALQWSYTLELPNSLFILAAAAIGPDDAIMVGVSEGGSDPGGASIYRVRQKAQANTKETEPVLEWVYKVDGWVRELEMAGSKLKALVEFPTKRRSYVWTFTGVTDAIPTLSSAYQVPYPSTCMALAEDGSSYTGHPVFADRDTTPGKPGVGISLESWTPDDLDNAPARIWGWWRAEDLAETYADRDEITLWEDRYGSGRVWTTGSPHKGSTSYGSPVPGPTMHYKGSLETPTIKFDGTQGLFSQLGGGAFAERDSCLSAVPNHGDGAFCIVIVCRPSTGGSFGQGDEDGDPLSERRWLLRQSHHTKYVGVAGANEPNGFDKNDTGAHISGIILNSEADAANFENDLYCWGKSKSLRGRHDPGKLRAFTSSSGYRFSGLHDGDGYDTAAWTVGSAHDYSGMPLLRGAGSYGWPKEGVYADLDSEDEGEGWCVITFMHCGGLSEYEDAPTGSHSGVVFTFDSEPAFMDRYPTGSKGTVYATKVSDGTTTSFSFAKSSNTTLAVGLSGTESYTGVRLVFARNHQTRSMLRINGEPVDRWEALPMAYTGASSISNPPPRTFNTNKNLELNQTGLGLAAEHDYIKGFIGEVAEIITIGNRTGPDSAVTLNSEAHYPAPTLLTHPKYAANAHTNDDVGGTDATNLDHPWKAMAFTGLSTELEKIEGYAMARYGISQRLQAPTADYPHPHYPEWSGNGLISSDLPLSNSTADSGQAWLPRLRYSDAMLTKHDETGKMLWCLLASSGYGTGTWGDLFSEDLNGTGGIFGFTSAPATSGVAVGLNGDVFVVGPGDPDTGDGDRFCMGRIDDSPESFEDPQITSVGWYTQGTPFAPDTNKLQLQSDVTIRCRCDEFGNFHVPVPPGALYLTNPALDAVRSFDRDGNLLFRLTTLNHGSTSYQNGYAVAFPPTSPTYNIED